jgi:hypothetical protein
VLVVPSSHCDKKWAHRALGWNNYASARAGKRMHRHLFGLWMSPRGFWFIAIVVVELLLQHYDRQQQRACKYILLDSGRAAHNRSPLCCAQDKFLEQPFAPLCDFCGGRRPGN